MVVARLDLRSARAGLGLVPHPAWHGAQKSRRGPHTVSVHDSWAAGHILSTAADNAFTVTANTVRIQAGVSAELSAAGVTAINGSLINPSGGGQPAARQGDLVAGNGGSGSIVTGSNTVLIGN